MSGVDAVPVEGRAWVITCNDSVELVVIGPEERARAAMEELRQAHFARSPTGWAQKGALMDEDEYLAYRRRVHWATRDVRCLAY